MFKTSKGDASTTVAENKAITEVQYKEEVENIQTKYEDMIKRMEEIRSEC